MPTATTRAEQFGPAVDHLEGCPGKPERTEVDERHTSLADGSPGPVVTVTHCVDCGTEAIFRGTKDQRDAALKKDGKRTTTKEAPADGGHEGSAEQGA